MKKICLILSLCLLMSLLGGCGAASAEPEETYELVEVVPMEENPCLWTPPA